MNQSQFNIRWQWLLLVVISALLYAGCVTTPKSYISPEVGYLVSCYQVGAKGDAQQADAMNSYAQRVAEEKLGTLKEGETLPALRRFKTQLEAPITVVPEALNGETSLMESQRRIMLGWFHQNPQNCSFHGEKVSPAWQQKLTWAGQRISELKGRFDSLLVQARQNLADGKFQEAAQNCKDALNLDPESAEVQTLARDIYPKWAGSYCSDQLAEVGKIQSRVAAQTKYYETDQFNDAVIQQCETDLNQAQAQLDDFRAWCDQNPEFQKVLKEREAELGQAEAQLADLRGTAWAQKIWLWREQRHYWSAYTNFIAAAATKELDLGGNKKHRLQAAEISAIQQHLREAYGRMLPEGMKFYIRNAARAAEGPEGESDYGLSLVLCRMAQELLEYAEAQQIQLLPEVETLRPALNLSLSKAHDALKAVLARQLVVKDFESPGLDTTASGHELTKRIYAEWLKRYPADHFTETPVPFWLLEIKHDAEQTSPIDYVVNGNVSKCYVGKLETRELSVTNFQIGLKPNPIDNPDPKTAKTTPTIFEQAKLNYERRVTMHKTTATIRADIFVSFGSKTIPCAAIDQEFDGINKQLPGCQLADSDIKNSANGPAQPARSPILANLKVDEPPPNKFAELSSDHEIVDALIDYARDTVLTNLEELVTKFPLDNLFQEGLRNDGIGNRVQAAEQFGRCLEYCSQLATLDKNLTANTGGNWLVWRKAMADRITDLEKAQWRTADPKLTAKIDNLWELAVTAAIAAADQPPLADSGP